MTEYLFGRLLVCASWLACAVFCGTSHANEPLTDEEREAAVRSLASYYAHFSDNHVQLVAKGEGTLEGSKFPIHYEVQFAQDKLFSRASTSVLSVVGGGDVPEEPVEPAIRTVFKRYDEDSQVLMEAHVLPDGSYDYIRKQCAQTDVGVSGGYSWNNLLQAIGWHRLLRKVAYQDDPLRMLRECRELVWHETADGQRQIVVTQRPIPTAALRYTFSNLPDVRLVRGQYTYAGRPGSGKSDLIHEIYYHANNDGLLVPYSSRTAYARSDPQVDIDDLRIRSTVEVVFESLTLTPLDQAPPLPEIKPIEGVRMIDDCAVAASREAGSAVAVPTPTPAP